MTPRAKVALALMVSVAVLWFGASLVRREIAGGEVGVIRQPVVQSEKVVLAGDHVLEAPPADFKPTVSADQSVALAGKAQSMEGADSVQPTLALYTNTSWRPVDPQTDEPIGPLQIQGLPVWVVVIDGICVYPVSYDPEAGIGASPECVNREALVFVDAETGDVMEILSYR
ncbi:MAG TPA: hypothetical protein VJN50_07100 [Actinomycetota bacterium]|nr:hypothetical protein [Actinomycetota bacterium]